MKKIIDGVTYNTKTAKLLFECNNGKNKENYLYFAFYQTKKGLFFQHVHGGENTFFARTRKHCLYPEAGEFIIDLDNNLDYINNAINNYKKRYIVTFDCEHLNN